MKKIILIRPHIHKKELPFQLYLYDEWIKTGISHEKSKCPTWRWLFHLIRHLNIPVIYENKRTAHIVLLGGGSVNWGAWPDSLFYEIIPVIWDCWPIYYDSVFGFIERNVVNTIIVTSKMTANVLKNRFPNKNILAITEGINISLYKKGDLLRNREIDLLEYGRSNKNVVSYDLSSCGFIHLKSSNGVKLFSDEKKFVDTLANAKVTLAFPRSVTNPEIAGNIETITQRYWENMLSRVVMIGKAPQELIELLGYNPVVEIDLEKSQEQL